MSTSTTTPAGHAGSHEDRRSIGRKPVLVVAVAAAVAATITWLATVLVGGVDLTVRAYDGGSREVGPVSIVVTSIVVTMVGGALLRWWQARSAHGTRNWTVLAVAVALVSLLGTTSARTLEAGTTLLSLHAVVAVAAIVGLRRATRAAEACS